MSISPGSTRRQRAPDLLSGPRALHAQQLRLATLIAIAQDEAAARRRRARRVWGLSVFGALASVGIVFQSCAGSKNAASANEKPLFHSAKAKPAHKQNETTEKPDKTAYDNAATDLQALFNSGLTPSASEADPGLPALEPDGPAPNSPTSRWATPNAVPVDPSQTPAPPAAATPDPGASTKPVSALDHPPTAFSQTKTREQRRVELTAELAGLLRPDAANNPDVLRALSSLIALEAVEPGAATPEIEAAIKPLSPDEAGAARVASDIVRTLASDPKLIADPIALRTELTRQLARLTTAPGAPAGEGLGFGTVALCSRVESFGRYTPFTGNRFLAGRTNPAIVYAEVENFTQRPVAETAGASGTAHRNADPDELAVELTIRAELFHDDGSRQWRSAEAAVRDIARTRRRDFFLVQRIDLPANLSVGKYNLKVTVRDRLGGDAVVETTIPITIVADPGLLGGGPSPMDAAPKPTAGVPTAGPQPLGTGPVSGGR